MTTDELIKALRAWAAAFRVKDGMGQLAKDLAAAADRLEKLDERVAIKEADEPHENEQSEGEQLTF